MPDIIIRYFFSLRTCNRGFSGERYPVNFCGQDLLQGINIVCIADLDSFCFREK